jgi:hypothetical protein
MHPCDRALLHDAVAGCRAAAASAARPAEYLRAAYDHY